MTHTIYEFLHYTTRSS